MVTKKSKPTQKNVKLGKLNFKKETVKDLSPKEAKKIKGGGSGTSVVATCPAVRCQIQ